MTKRCNTLNPLLRRRRTMMKPDYIHFEDPVVEKICAETWGDGTGLTYAQAARVSSIGETFKGNTNITSFDEMRWFTRMTQIPNYAFEGCTNLASIGLSSSITLSGFRSFNKCTNLHTVYYWGELVSWIGITIGETGGSMTGNGADLYINGVLLENLVVPDSITTINNNVFLGVQSITSLTVPSSVTIIGGNTFAYCYNLTGNLNIPSSVISIRSGAFNHCSGLTGSLVLPSSLTQISNNTFESCTGFTGSLVIPNSVTLIGNAAFYECTGLTSLTISNGVESIGNNAFKNCSGFTGNLDIPSSVTSIGSSAFENCSGFTGSLSIPDNVTNIGNNAFTGCKFTNVYIAERFGVQVFTNCTNGQGITVAEGNRYIDGYYANSKMDNKYVVIKGNCSLGNFFSRSTSFEALWVEGNLVCNGSYGISYCYGSPSSLSFVEVGGTITTTNGNLFGNLERADCLADGCILHLAYNDIATTPAIACASYSRLAKIYVGDGTSSAADQAILNLYLADPDWAQYSSKLDLWSNYNGKYKTQPVFPTN